MSSLTVDGWKRLQPSSTSPTARTRPIEEQRRRRQPTQQRPPRWRQKTSSLPGQSRRGSTAATAAQEEGLVDRTGCWPDQDQRRAIQSGTPRTGSTSSPSSAESRAQLGGVDDQRRQRASRSIGPTSPAPEPRQAARPGLADHRHANRRRQPRFGDGQHVKAPARRLGIPAAARSTTSDQPISSGFWRHTASFLYDQTDIC